jgi:hypothetical protein
MTDRNSRDAHKGATSAPFDVPPSAVRPCYICGQTVGLTEGWHRNGHQWCENHQPVWSRERLKCQVPHPDDRSVKCARRYGHAGDHSATTKGPQTQWWKVRSGDWEDDNEGLVDDG